MANKKISQLAAAGTLTGDELVEVVQDGSNVKTTAQDIADLGGGGSLPFNFAYAWVNTGSVPVGPPTLEPGHRGVTSVQRLSTGSYKINLSDVYSTLVAPVVTYVSEVTNTRIQVNALTTGSPSSFVVQFYNGGSLSDPLFGFILHCAGT